MDKPCGCQHGRLRSLISAKLGRCRSCMRLSIVGTLAAWAMVGLLYALWPNPILLTLALLSAGSFTLLLVSHGVAVMARTAAQRGARDDRAVARPTFPGPLGKAAVAAVGAPLLSRLGGAAIRPPLLAAPPAS